MHENSVVLVNTWCIQMLSTVQTIGIIIVWVLNGYNKFYGNK